MLLGSCRTAFPSLVCPMLPLFSRVEDALPDILGCRGSAASPRPSRCWPGAWHCRRHHHASPGSTQGQLPLPRATAGRCPRHLPPQRKQKGSLFFLFPENNWSVIKLKPLSDVPLAWAISVPEEGSISLSTGSCQLRTRSAPGEMLRWGCLERTAFQTTRRTISTAFTEGSETFHHRRHEGNYWQRLSGRCPLEPGDVRGLGCEWEPRGAGGPRGAAVPQLQRWPGAGRGRRPSCPVTAPSQPWASPALKRGAESIHGPHRSTLGVRLVPCKSCSGATMVELREGLQMCGWRRKPLSVSWTGFPRSAFSLDSHICWGAPVFAN